MAKRSKAILKEFFGAERFPSGAQFAELIDSLEDTLAPITLTIVSAAITVTQKRHKLDTEGQAASDTLSTINGGSDGEELILRLLTDAHTVTIDLAGNIDMTSSFSMATDHAVLHLMYNGDTSKWNEVARSS